jgi:hypothetical protein
MSYPVEKQHLIRPTSFREYVARQLGNIEALPDAALSQKLFELERTLQGELQAGDELWEWSSSGSHARWDDPNRPAAASGVAILRNDQIVRSWMILTG